MKYIEKNLILSFFEELTNSNIEYVLIKNIDNELPEKLQDGKDIDILVKQEDKEKFEKFMIQQGFIKRIPPLGRKNGWNFAYQLPEYQFWQKEKVDCIFYIDASFKLSCKSLTPKTWIPLDDKINIEIWKNKVFDKKNNWWIMDNQTILIYMIVRSIFDKQEFKAGYIIEIEKRKSLLEEENTRFKLSKIFFKYTDRLIYLIKKGQYEDIIIDYFTFVDY